jgi:hypothetical protein
VRQLEFRVDRAEAPPATKYERRAGAVLPPEASGGAAVFLTEAPETSSAPTSPVGSPREDEEATPAGDGKEAGGDKAAPAGEGNDAQAEALGYAHAKTTDELLAASGAVSDGGKSEFGQNRGDILALQAQLSMTKASVSWLRDDAVKRADTQLTHTKEERKFLEMALDNVNRKIEESNLRTLGIHNDMEQVKLTQKTLQEETQATLAKTVADVALAMEKHLTQEVAGVVKQLGAIKQAHEKQHQAALARLEEVKQETKDFVVTEIVEGAIGECPGRCAKLEENQEALLERVGELERRADDADKRMDAMQEEMDAGFQEAAREREALEQRCDERREALAVRLDGDIAELDQRAAADRALIRGELAVETEQRLQGELALRVKLEATAEALREEAAREHAVRVTAEEELAAAQRLTAERLEAEAAARKAADASLEEKAAELRAALAASDAERRARENEVEASLAGLDQRVKRVDSELEKVNGELAAQAKKIHEQGAGATALLEKLQAEQNVQRKEASQVKVRVEVLEGEVGGMRVDVQGVKDSIGSLASGLEAKAKAAAEAAEAEAEAAEAAAAVEAAEAEATAAAAAAAEAEAEATAAEAAAAEAAEAEEAEAGGGEGGKGGAGSVHKHTAGQGGGWDELAAGLAEATETAAEAKAIAQEAKDAAAALQAKLGGGGGGGEGGDDDDVGLNVLLRRLREEFDAGEKARLAGSALGETKAWLKKLDGGLAELNYSTGDDKAQQEAEARRLQKDAEAAEERLATAEGLTEELQAQLGELKGHVQEACDQMEDKAGKRDVAESIRRIEGDVEYLEEKKMDSATFKATEDSLQRELRLRTKKRDVRDLISAREEEISHEEALLLAGSAKAYRCISCSSVRAPERVHQVRGRGGGVRRG